MIYKKSPGDIRSCDEKLYRLALKNLEFKNIKGNEYTIEKDTLFSFLSEYIPEHDEYELDIKCYDFGGGSAESTGHVSPLTVQNALFIKMNSQEYSRFISDTESGTASMEKSAFEKTLICTPEIVRFSREMEILVRDHLEFERETDILSENLENASTLSLERIIRSVFESIIDTGEKIEDSIILNQLFRMGNGGFAGLLGVIMIYNLGSSNEISRMFVFLMLLLTLICVLNALTGPSETAKFFRTVLCFPLQLLAKFYSFGRRDERKMLTDSLNNRLQAASSNEYRQSDLRKKMKSDFPRILNEIFGNHQPHESADMESVRFPVFFREPVPASQIKETETRTDEELRGGCERVMYPVYADNSETESDSSGRKVISLFKERNTETESPVKGKVDLRKK